MFYWFGWLCFIRLTNHQNQNTSWLTCGNTLSRSFIRYSLLLPLVLFFLSSHISSLGLVVRLVWLIFVLFFFGGVFIVFIPAVFVQFKLLAGEKIYYPENPFNFFENWRKGNVMFNRMFRWCPDWMRKVLYGSFIYAFFNFFLNMGNEKILMTGHILPFYAFPAGIYYSTLRIDFDDVPTCLNGH